jgi:hypothetical protein
MQLIQRQTLLYQEGRSHKVYEIDLCQLGESRYVVNFRYGKQGSTLKEGSETIAAVPLAEAQRIFQRAINAKLQKGYRDITGQSPSEIEALPASDTTTQPVGAPTDPNQRAQVILNRLTAAVNAPPGMTAVSIGRSARQHWSLSRVIWRAGELHLRAAAPLLMQLLGNDALTDYCVAWALGQCGDQSAIPTLEGLYRQQTGAAGDRQSAIHVAVQRIALAAIFKLADSGQCSILRAELLNHLPGPLRELAQSGSAETFTAALRDFLNQNDYQQFQIIDTLYHLNTEPVRSALLELARTAPLRPNYFQRLRHLFKLSEYCQDAELFGILAYRFEQEAALYRSNKRYIRLPDSSSISRSTYRYDSLTGRYATLENPEFQREMQRPDARIAYSTNTREYLRRRVWRTLQHLGELGEPSYVNLAVSILLQYSDENAQPVRETIHYRWDRTTWQRYESSRIFWGEYAGYLTFNHILYTNSPRYVLKSGSNAWRCRPSHRPIGSEPMVREEAFPHLWERQPAALLQLLVASRCLPVHQFATKALRACPTFCADLSIEALIQLLNRPYEVTARLGFELAQARYQPDHPHRELLLAIAHCNYQPARAAVYGWITDQRDRFLSDPQLLAGLVTSPQPETWEFAHQLLSTAILPEATARSLVGQIIAAVLALDAGQGEIAGGATETLLLCFVPQLRTIGLEIVLDLLRHPLLEVRTLGARILLNHETPAIDLPAGLIDALLESPHEAVRVIGVRLFSQLPDHRLLEHTQLLLTLATHELSEMRDAIRPAIRRLTSNHPEFGAQLAMLLLEVLLTPEVHAGVHNFLAQLLQTDIPDWMNAVTPDQTLSLLQTTSSAAQEVAGSMLQANSDRWAPTFTTPQLAQWTHHEVRAVRDAAHQMLTQILSRLHQSEAELLEAVTVLESRWDDAQAFGQRLFAELLSAQQLTPSVVISICDSNRLEVRRFGRDLVSRCFRASDAQEYLLKFSEHPATDMQLFATQYLESDAIDNPQRLRELMPYFVRVLSQVNRGRIARQRIFAFLKAEATKSEAAAQVVAEILARQAAAIAVGDRANALETLLQIHHTYPHLSLPIQVKAVPLKPGTRL